jgi:hypothetical protein
MASSSLRVMIAWDFEADGIWLISSGVSAVHPRVSHGRDESDRHDEIKGATVFSWSDVLSDSVLIALKNWNDMGSELYGPRSIDSSALVVAKESFWRQAEELAEIVHRELGPSATVWHQNGDGNFSVVSYGQQQSRIS